MIEHPTAVLIIGYLLGGGVLLLVSREEGLAMSDLVKRLRDRVDEQERCNSYPVDRAMDREAADRIEALEAALRPFAENPPATTLRKMTMTTDFGMFV